MKEYGIEAINFDYYESTLIFKDHQGKKRTLKLTDSQRCNLIFSQEIYKGLLLWIRIDEKYATVANIPEVIKIDVEYMGHQGHRYSHYPELPALKD